MQQNFCKFLRFSNVRNPVNAREIVRRTERILLFWQYGLVRVKNMGRVNVTEKKPRIQLKTIKKLWPSKKVEH